MDRILKAQGAQAQRRMKQYLQSKQWNEELWIPGQKFMQTGGPVWPLYTTEKYWQQRWRDKKWSRELSAKDLTWWEAVKEDCNTPVQMWAQAESSGSIFHAQAEEIRGNASAERLISQYKGL